MAGSLLVIIGIKLGKDGYFRHHLRVQWTEGTILSYKDRYFRQYLL